MGDKAPVERLRRELGLVDVFAISTGAMFSSGFFLLPGIAYTISGAWMVLAYALSALLVVPAMLSKAELASALPRAGGTYYYLDRSMGPLVGTIGGLGTWVAMGLKNTFALIGVGAYLALFLDVPVVVLALSLAGVFTLLNILGSKETARLQRWMVYALVAILLAFVLAGFVQVTGEGFVARVSDRLANAPKADVDGILATVGLVFVSYAGLTKVSGVAEEVIRPDRDILLGMKLSLATAAAIYVLGTAVLILVVSPDRLAGDLTPVATAAEVVFGGLPGRIGVGLIVVAAVAAFASTANAGIMAASRYLLAMGRDRLIGSRFRKLGRFGTPTPAVLATGVFIVFALLTLDVVSVAKLASAFQLLMFALVNLAVIVMRESRIETYDPAVPTPLYPWVQLLGIFASLAMIVEMGRMPMIFTLGLVAACVGWYFFYAQKRVVRRGAILHWFERLGRDRFDALETEMWSIVKETGLRSDDPYEEVVAAAPLLELEGSLPFAEAGRRAAVRMTASVDPVATAEAFATALGRGLVPVGGGVAMAHLCIPEVSAHELLLVRAPGGIEVEAGDRLAQAPATQIVQALLVLVSPEDESGLHLRLLAHLATQVEQPHFLDTWLQAEGAAELRRLLTDDPLARLASRLTRELRDRPARVWHPHTHPGRFESIMLVDPGGPAEAPLVEFVGELAGRNQARVTVAEPADLAPRRAAVDSPAPGTGGATAAERLTTAVEPLRAQGLEARTLLLPGKPWLETIREVLRNSHDLVVVADAPGRGFSTDVLHLLRKCPCPVWVVRPTAGLRPRRILAAVDATATDEAHRSLNEVILAFATLVTESEDTELHIVHAWRPGAPRLEEVLETAGTADGDWRRAFTTVMEDLLQRHRVDRKRTHIHVVEGVPAPVIAGLAEEIDADLVIMGTVCRTGVAGLLIGNTAETVLREVSCAALAVKPEGFVTPVELD